MFRIIVVIFAMVVKTRSHHNKKSAPSTVESTEVQEIYSPPVRSSGRKKSSHKGLNIITPSLLEASTRTYKIFKGDIDRSTARARKVVSNTATATAADADADADAEAEAAAVEALVHMNTEYDYSDSDITTISDNECHDEPLVSISHHACMNPMRPVTQLMYRMDVYNSSRTLHYKTAFIIYNSYNTMYYIYSIISNSYPDDSGVVSHSSPASLPHPTNTIQTKYTSYRDEAINYIMTMIVPSNEYDYSITDDMIGVVTTKDEFKNWVFSEDSTYYDVDFIMNEKSSKETTNGYKSFFLIPSRNYLFDPIIPSTVITAYTPEIVKSVLSILYQSR